ncbi:MAG: hypothetical protein RJA76_261 [Bacteroidota bacterium]|jgi:hypothetical protein
MKYLILLISIITFPSIAQQIIPLKDLSAFDAPSKNWTIEGRLKGSPSDSLFQVSMGEGILLNTLRGGKYHREDDLKFKLKHGDIHLKLEFMLPKGANSGIYLQGRYELQLFDSWNKKQIKFSDCGGIYERWDEKRGKGNEGYEGYAPRVNASKAPGLWQKLEIEFQAPRFDASGKKIKNAIFKKVILNGVIIHENIMVSGMTRGALFEKEEAYGPITIQGDHGQVAFKNIWYETYDLPSISPGKVSYKVFEGKFPDLKEGEAKVVFAGTSDKITQKSIELRSDFLAKFEEDFEVPELDDYDFKTNWTGSGYLSIDGQILNTGAHWYTENVFQKIKLDKGKHHLVLVYAKDFPWGPKSLGVSVKRVGSRWVDLHERTSLPDPEAVGMIELKAESEPVFQRSFFFHKGIKKTHVIHVGDPSGIHYSYNLKQGALLQVWKGKFLNVTQMWENRGEPQTSEALGAPIVLDGKFPIVVDHQNQEDSLQADQLVYKGYKIENGRPIFIYDWKSANLQIEDRIEPNEKGTGLTRKLKIVGAGPNKANLQLVAANATLIDDVQTNLNAINGNEYFVKWKKGKSEVLKLANHQFQMRLPLEGEEFNYEIIW